MKLTQISVVRGFVWKYDDDISTDYIAPNVSRFDMLPGGERWTAMGQAAMEGTPKEKGDPSFGKRCKKGDVIVAGQNFGCGSSREEGALTIKAAGAGAVIAESFARLWYRNAVNNGLIAIEINDARQFFQNGDEIIIDLQEGIIRNLSTDIKITVKPFPKFISDMIEKGGLIPSIKSRYMDKG